MRTPAPPPEGDCPCRELWTRLGQLPRARQRAELQRLIQAYQRHAPSGMAPWLTQLWQTRASIRRYQDRPLAAELLDQFQMALAHAATSRNRQARRFAFIRDARLRRALVEQGGMQEFVATAPLVVAGCATARNSRGAAYDVLISLTQLEATAASAGLGTCWLGWYDEAAVHHLLGLPPDYQVIVLMALGYAAEEPAPQPKLAPRELVWFDRFPAGEGPG